MTLLVEHLPKDTDVLFGSMLPLPSAIEVDETCQEDEFLSYSLPALAWGCSSSSRSTPRPPGGRAAKNARPSSQPSPASGRPWANSAAENSERRARTAPVKKKPTSPGEEMPWAPVSPPRAAFPQTSGSQFTSAFSLMWSSSGAPNSQSLLLDSLTDVVSSVKGLPLGSLRNKPRRWLLSDAFLKKYMFSPGSPLLGAESPSTFSSPTPRKQGRPASRGSDLPSARGSPCSPATAEGLSGTAKGARKPGTAEQGNRADPLAASPDDVPSLEALRLSVQQEREAWLQRRALEFR